MRLLILGAVLLLLRLNLAFELKPRIINGFAAKRGQYPFYAFLVMQTLEKNISRCGGSLISDQFVLTAAHCTQPFEKIAVYLGMWKAKDKNEIGRYREVVGKRNFYVHPNYNVTLIINDISLIKLKAAITFTANIQPIRLQDTCESNENISVIAIGNGYFSSKHQIAPILQWAPLTTISYPQCMKYYKFDFIAWHTKITICAESSHKFPLLRPPTCIKQGDSGSALLRRRDGLLIGMSSFTTSNSTDLTTPQGFVNLIAYHEWIANITKMNLTICK